MRTSFSTCTNGYHYDPLLMWEKENEQVEKKNKDPFEQVEQVDHMQLIIDKEKRNKDVNITMNLHQHIHFSE